MALGIGSAIGKIFSWLPSGRQVKETRIYQLTRENEKLQKINPLTDVEALRFQRNAVTIKQLRTELSRSE